MSSLVRYFLALAGSGSYAQLTPQKNVNVSNLLARRITGSGKSARFPVLHARAGIVSSRNLYSQYCAGLVNLVLRIHSWLRCAFHVDLGRAKKYELSSKEEKVNELSSKNMSCPPLPSREWLFQILNKSPPDCYRPHVLIAFSLLST